ncbi:MAG: hypothetical protein H6701_10620 [Myxococcales bacterium]|nr:hypothetical protein [Myxococcales bacterium]
MSTLLPGIARASSSAAVRARPRAASAGAGLDGDALAGDARGEDAVVAARPRSDASGSARRAERERLDERGDGRVVARWRASPRRAEQLTGVVTGRGAGAREREAGGVEQRAEVDAEPVDPGEQLEAAPVGDRDPGAGERAAVQLEPERRDDPPPADEVAAERA